MNYDAYKINIESIDLSPDLSMREVYGIDKKGGTNQKTDSSISPELWFSLHRNIHLSRRILRHFCKKTLKNSSLPQFVHRDWCFAKKRNKNRAKDPYKEECE